MKSGVMRMMCLKVIGFNKKELRYNIVMKEVIKKLSGDLDNIKVNIDVLNNEMLNKIDLNNIINRLEDYKEVLSNWIREIDRINN